MLEKTCRDRIISEIIDPLNLINNELTYIFVCDAFTLPLLSLLFKRHELFDYNVVDIYYIGNQGANKTGSDAIYFLRPTVINATSIINDLKHKGKRRYRCVHVFWATDVFEHTPCLKPIIDSQAVIPLISSHVGFNMAFGCINDFTISLGLNDFLYICYNKCNGEKSVKRRQENLDTCISRLLSVFITLKRTPETRFYCHGMHSDLARSIGAKLDTEIRTKYSHILEKATTAKFLILDRSFDPNPLIIHDFTFEAFLYDSMKIPTNAMDSTINQGRNDKLQLKLDDGSNFSYVFYPSTEIYKQIRYMHINSAVQYLHKQILAISNRLTNAQKSLSSHSDGVGRAHDTYELKRSVSQYNSYFTLVNRLLEYIELNSLTSYSRVEQSIATGVSSSGSQINTLTTLEEIAIILAAQGEILEERKLRILLLYLFNFDGITQSDIEIMIRNSSFSSETLSIMDFLLRLKIACTTETAKHNARVKHSHRSVRRPELLRKYKTAAKNSQLHLSLFEPELKDLAFKFCTEQLPENEFVYTKVHSNARNSSRIGSSLRFDPSDWEWTDEKAERGTESGSPDYIVFVLGPIMLSEIRVVNEIRDITKKNIILIGTRVASPYDILESARRFVTSDYDFSS